MAFGWRGEQQQQQQPHISTHLEANRILHRLPPLLPFVCITLTWSSFEWNKHKPHRLAVLCVETQAIREINLLVLGSTSYLLQLSVGYTISAVLKLIYGRIGVFTSYFLLLMFV
jgi:hypothetical protein